MQLAKLIVTLGTSALIWLMTPIGGIPGTTLASTVMQRRSLFFDACRHRMAFRSGDENPIVCNAIFGNAVSGTGNVYCEP
jgi:hypothetical protein